LNLAVIRVIAKVYLLSALFFLCSAFFFYSRIFVFGYQISPLFANIVRLVFLFMSVYLFLNLPKLKIHSFFTACAFHLFFIGNSLLMLAEKYVPQIHPAVRIAGLYGSLEYSFNQEIIIILNIIINSAMISYILLKRELFFSLRGH